MMNQISVDSKSSKTSLKKQLWMLSSSTQTFMDGLDDLSVLPICLHTDWKFQSEGRLFAVSHCW